MPARQMDEETLQAALAALDEHGMVSEAAKALGIPPTTLKHRLKVARERGVTPGGKPPKEFTIDPLPPASVPIEKRIDQMVESFERRFAREKAKRWRSVEIRLEGPVGVQWFGDPHLDDNGCNWPLLKRDVELIRKTKGLFAANVGDTTNNWIGRLSRLYANQDTSHETALELATWLLTTIPWLLVIRGNHDLWSGPNDLLKWIASGTGAATADWQAQLQLKFPNGRSAKVWAAHSFPGSSQWNPLHSGMKRAAFSGEASLYISGHHHEWALWEGEDAYRGACYWVAKARGYKFMDTHADQLGFGSQQFGASITSIFDPEGEGPAFLRCFSDAAEAAEYLTWKRSRGRGKS